MTRREDCLLTGWGRHRAVNDSSRFTRRIRKDVDENGVRASLATDIDVVICLGGASSARSTVRVKQDKTARAAPKPPTDPKETP